MDVLFPFEGGATNMPRIPKHCQNQGKRRSDGNPMLKA